jgi:hypothetical protein
MSAAETRDPASVTTDDGTVWVRRTITRGGRGLYAPAAVSGCPEHVMATLEELAEHGVRADSEPEAARPEAALPSRFTATPAQVNAYLRTILAEDTYLRFQQAIGAHALGEVVEDAGVVRASADNDGLYNADWREGWDDAIERIDPDLCGPAPSTLIAFADPECPPVAESADRLTRLLAPTQALRLETGGNR